MPANQELLNCTTGTVPAGPSCAVRVLLVAPYAPSGGGMGRIMEYLSQSVADNPALVFEKLESRGPGPASHAPWYMLRAAWHILKAALSRQPVIVHVNMADGGSVFRKGALLLLARALGLPAVLHLHAADIIGFHSRLWAPSRAVMGIIFRAASVCIVLGHPYREFLQARLAVPRRRIEILRNGVPRPVLFRFPPPPSLFSFVFVGNLLARKGLVDLLHAAADPVLAGGNWRLVIAGGGDAAKLRRLAVTLGINGRVAFTGWLGRADTTHVLAQAGALVLPSYQEALPLVLAEAASLGVPIITTPVGAIAELFRNDENALLVAPGDRRALADAMYRLSTSPETAKRIGRQGRALYEHDLTMDRFVSGLLSIYARHCQPAQTATQSQPQSQTNAPAPGQPQVRPA